MSSLLAIDTSNQYCSVALSHQGRVIELHERAEQQHSQVVLPMVGQVLDKAGIKLVDLDAFVVGIGPGGFTGVRLAVAVIQGLAFATHKQVITLSSLLAMAQAACLDGTARVVTAAMDARMQEVYHATYRVSAAGVEELHAPSLSKLNDFIHEQNEWVGQADFGLVGNATTQFVEISDWLAQHNINVFEIDHSAPHASDLLPMGQIAYQKNEMQLPEHIAPLYVRDKIAQTIAERNAVKGLA